ncbi:MAG TPA: tyrosine-type recombinase/integrase [Bryobacteraceae bacterium]|jgi:integrase
MYSLRRTCLTRSAAAGMDAPALQYLAGHKNIATTMKYIHLAQADIQARLTDPVEDEKRRGAQIQARQTILNRL